MKETLPPDVQEDLQRILTPSQMEVMRALSPLPDRPEGFGMTADEYAAAAVPNLTYKNAAYRLKVAYNAKKLDRKKVRHESYDRGTFLYFIPGTWPE